eukprot:gene2667-3863_t
MKNLLFVVSLIIYSTIALEFANIGDSWGTHGFRVFQQKCKQTSPNSKVSMFAVGGTTAQQWASSQGIQKLKKIFTNNPNITHIWMTVGGNDAMNLCRQRKCDEYEASVLKDSRNIMKLLVSLKPSIKVSSLGYDLLSWERDERCKRTFSVLFRGQSYQTFRRQFIDRFTRLNQQIEKEFPKNYYYVPIWGRFIILTLLIQTFKGVMQKAGGIVNPPNVNFGSPDKYYSDCIHPNDSGFRIVMENFFENLKKRNYF